MDLPSPLRRAQRHLLFLAVLAALVGGTWVPAPAVAAEPPADEPIGYDISYPQCGGRFPTDVAFAVVGVNGGRAFTENPCLGAGNGASQLAWAGPDAQFYLNTGNPGPEHSKAPWPTGQLMPRFCSWTDPDSAACAYDYGWNTAAYAYHAALAAHVSLGWAASDARRTPAPAWWWLDVETGNSWRDETELNVATLQGAIDYLETMDVAGIGIYSIGPMWDEITGGSHAFADYPNWVAGSSTINGARRTCIGPGFSGGPVLMTQYLHDGFDANHRC